MKKKHADDPVFVDRTGRRRRLLTAAGSVGGLVLVLVVLAFVAGFTGAGPVAVPGWPDAAARPVRGKTSTAAPRRSPSPPARPRTVETTPARPTGASPRPSGPAPASSTPVASPAPAQPSATTVTPAPGNNGRRPSHTPNPHSTKNR